MHETLIIHNNILFLKCMNVHSVVNFIFVINDLIPIKISFGPMQNILIIPNDKNENANFES